MLETFAVLLPLSEPIAKGCVAPIISRILILWASNHRVPSIDISVHSESLFYHHDIVGPHADWPYA